jgi:hypothetical protein
MSRGRGGGEFIEFIESIKFVELLGLSGSRCDGISSKRNSLSFGERLSGQGYSPGRRWLRDIKLAGIRIASHF